MQIPKKISEKILLNNWYAKILEKIFINRNWKEHNFIIGSRDWTNIWTIVLPITKNWEIVYIKEYRQWPEKYIISFPMWILEEWLTPEENCKKELIEETWYISNEFEFVWDSIIDNYAEWSIKYYIAKNCENTFKQALEPSEFIEVFKTSIKNFEKMITSWKVECPRTWYLFFLAKNKWLI